VLNRKLSDFRTTFICNALQLDEGSQVNGVEWHPPVASKRDAYSTGYSIPQREQAGGFWPPACGERESAARGRARHFVHSVEFEAIFVLLPIVPFAERGIQVGGNKNRVG